MGKNNSESFSLLTPEELLGPPKIDFLGVLLISFLAGVVGLIVGIIVFISSFLVLGNMSIQTAISPILLAIITFFATLIGNYIYLWGLVNIFPNMYTGSRTLAMHISIYSIVLYVFIAPVYLIIDIYTQSLYDQSAILYIYSAHIIFNIFGFILITGVLSIYRYSLLVVYSTIIALLISSLIPVISYATLQSSMNTIFIFIAFSVIAFFNTTVIGYGILYLYYKLYTLTGYDPIGNTLNQIAQDETDMQKKAEKILFQ